MTNGLDERSFPPILLCDVDDVLFFNGVLNMVAVERLQAYVRDRWRVVLFTTCGPGDPKVRTLAAHLPGVGYLPKPLACRYGFFDDRLDPDNCGRELLQGACPWT